MPEVFSTLTRPGGAAKANEVVRIRLLASSTGEAEGFVSSTQAVILDEYPVLTDATGRWAVTLTANALITPANTVYQVIQPGTNGTKVTETFIVPNTAGPFWLGNILAAAPVGLPQYALDAHEAAADPHSAYLTAAEGNAAYVTLTTAQTITGVKTFSANPVFNDAAIPVAKISGLTTALANYVTLDSAQTITGAKTFSQPVRSNQFQLESGGILQAVTGTGSYIAVSGGGSAEVVGRTTGVAALIVRGAPSQTGDLQQWQNSAGAVLAKVEASGNLDLLQSRLQVIRNVGGPLVDINNVEASGELRLYATNSIVMRRPLHVGTTGEVPAASVSLIVRGAVSQTADLQQWQNSAGTVLAKVTAAGRFMMGTPATAPADTDLANSQLSFWIDEASNLLAFKVKWSNGAVKTGTVALT